MTKSKSTTTLDAFEAQLSAELALVARDPGAYVEAARPPTIGNPITLGERVIAPDKWATKQVDRAKAGANDWLENSKRPRKVPSKAALEANDKRLDKLAKSIADKTWEGAMAKVDEDLRIQVIDNVGARGFADGVDAHKPKVDAKAKKLQPLVLGLAKTLDAMPQKTDADREAKMIAAKRGMQAIGKVLKT